MTLLRTRKEVKRLNGEGPCSICPGTATHDKPYCINCIHHMPYVNKLLGEFAQQEHEKTGHVNPEGERSKDIVEYLRLNGTTTVKRLARDLCFDLSILEHYLAKLKKCDFIEMLSFRDRDGHKQTVVRA